MDQKNYWDQAAQTKTFTTPFQASLFMRHVPKDRRILDVGCGYGRTLSELHDLGYTHLAGCDFSEAMIRRGHKLYPFLDLRVKKSAALDFPDHSIDAVILFAVLTCICRNEEQEALIREIRRLLVPGGLLYVNDFLLNDDRRNLDRYARFQPVYKTYGVFELPEGGVLRHHREEWIHQLLSDFTELEWEQLTFATMNGHQSRGFCFLGKK